MKLFFALATGAALALSAACAQGAVVYNTWSSNVAPNGNYELTITHNPVSSTFNYNLTVNPWNAEGLGLFIDFGNRDISGPVSLTNVSPSGEVALHALETTSHTCGTGCNLNGLTLPSLGDGEWELVFRLGDTGFEGIQTFSWTTQDFGLDESALGLLAIRAQQLCTSGTLPSGSCEDSDKVYGFGNRTTTIEATVPEPGSLVLLAAALLIGYAMHRQARNNAANQ
jgi:hypothetical protein